MASELVQRLSANAWARRQRFYYPMPPGNQSPVAPPESHGIRVLVPDMADYAWKHARETIQNRFNGKPPQCATCDVVIACFPFHAVESREFIECEHCAYTEMHAGHDGRCAGSPYCTPGC